MQKELRISGGVVVRESTGAGAKAGIAPGDIILAINHTDVESPKQFVSVAGKLDKARAAGLLVRRGDATQWVAVTPAK